MTTEDNGEVIGHDPFDFSDICDALRDETTAVKINQLIETDEIGIEVRLSSDLAKLLGSISTDITTFGPLKSNFHGMRGH